MDGRIYDINIKYSVRIVIPWFTHVREIIHSIKLMDYLDVQVEKTHTRTHANTCMWNL